FVAWAFGVLVSVPFWVSEAYTGALAKAHPDWGDLSMYVGALGTVLAYLATYRLRPLWTRPAGRAAQPRSTTMTRSS
ncbi:MAG TPA: hypothetical protein VH008_33545, partial [Pseudonocardia sp.]|nr:hypothetical protein [Pseudonocardia sp.]